MHHSKDIKTLKFTRVKGGFVTQFTEKNMTESVLNQFQIQVSKIVAKLLFMLLEFCLHDTNPD